MNHISNECFSLKKPYDWAGDIFFCNFPCYFFLIVFWCSLVEFSIAVYKGLYVSNCLSPSNIKASTDEVLRLSSFFCPVCQ